MLSSVLQVPGPWLGLGLGLGLGLRFAVCSLRTSLQNLLGWGGVCVRPSKKTCKTPTWIWLASTARDGGQGCYQ